MTNWVKNIAKLLLLLTTILLLTGTRYAHAQNTGDYPYLDSEHAYAVKIGRVGNDSRWVVTNKNGDTYEITSSNDYNWFDIQPATEDETDEIVNIFFDENVFSEGTWYLQYFEDQLQADNTTTCVSAREYKIVIVENEFYLTLAGDDNICNSQSGKLNLYNDLLNNEYETELTYMVTMNKETDYDPDFFSFEVSFDRPIVNNSLSINVPGNNSTAVFSGNNDSIVTVNPPAGGFPNQVDVELQVAFSNSVLEGYTPSFTANNGQAVNVGVAPVPDAVTHDGIYPVGNSNDRTQAITVYAIPATKDITYGEGETETSAKNPLQKSTHNYLVEMHNSANNHWWTMEAAEGDGPVLSTDYFLSETGVGANQVNAEITFTGNMPVGQYTLYFEEENTHGCSTIRSYDINLGEPFDVDLFVAAGQCPAISGNVNNENNPTATVIGDTVRMINGGYSYNWQFDFEITSNQGFSPADVEISSIDVVPTAGQVSNLSSDNTTGTVTVTNSQENPVTSVVLNVTYYGVYRQGHTITVNITNIEGSFNEQDADENNNGTHIIYSLPQAGMLAGVD